MPDHSRGAITSVAVNQIRLELDRPVRNGTQSITERRYLVTRVRTADGVEGRSCVLTRNLPLIDAVASISELLRGRTVFESETIHDQALEAGDRFWGSSGLYPRALSALDIAIWDAKAQILGVPVTDLVGGTTRDVPILVASGYYDPTNDLDKLRAEYLELSDAGFRRLKIMAGGADVATDARRIAAVREVLPDDARLGVDVNGAWGSIEQARRFLGEVGDTFDFIEDPFRPSLIELLPGLRRISNTRVAVGEWESSLPRIRRMIDGGGVDVLRLDATALGGPSGFVRAHALAVAAGLRVLPHYYPEIHVHLVGSGSAVEAIEVVPRSSGADNFDELTTSVPWEYFPSTSVARSPGFGVGWNDSVLDQNSELDANWALS